MALVCWLGLVPTAQANAGALGQALFERGVFDSGLAQSAVEPSSTLSARTGAEGAWVLRGAAVACANCHGLDANGGGEGFQRIPGLRWSEWSSTDPAIRAAALTRLQRAVVDGIGADGQTLSQAMPRFDLDTRALQALAGHVGRLATAAPVVGVPVFALIRLRDTTAPDLERAVHKGLRQCLTQRLGQRIRLELREIRSPADAQAAWRELRARPEIVAVLAPPWRGWRPERSAATGRDPPVGDLPSLFPLVADPDPQQPHTQWLFGGEQARTAALVMAWMTEHPREPLPVWVGRGPDGEARWAALAALADAVLRDAGERPRWVRLAEPRGQADRAGLWLEAATLPTNGWWLMPWPVAPQPGVGSRWWMAQPYPGKSQRGLAQRWVDATCTTVQAVLAQATPPTRRNWVDLVGSVGRLNDGQGWAWRVPGGDSAAFGAASGWSVVEFGAAQAVRLVTPLVDLSPPAPSAR
jgi:hypothetical protein